MVERPNGADWGNMPPLRPPWNRDEIWRALDERVIEHVSTDDYTGPLSNRNGAGLDLPAPPAGHNGMETRLAVLYHEAVVKRGWSLERFVEIAGTGIARKLGLWPRKGSLMPGADADLVVFDPERSWHLPPRRAAHGRLQHLGRVRVRGAARDDDPARRADGARRGRSSARRARANSCIVHAGLLEAALRTEKSATRGRTACQVSAGRAVPGP